MPEFLARTPHEVLVGHGYNITLRNKQEVINDPDHLSFESKLIGIAIGLLLSENYAQQLILSTGPTIKGISESEHLRKFILRQFPHLIGFPITLEENSLDTSENAKESIKIIKNLGLEDAAIISLKDHAINAAKLYGHFGHPIPENGIIGAENVIYQRLLSTSKEDAEIFRKNFVIHQFLSGNKHKELARSFLLATFDKDGHKLNQITKITRG